MAIIMYRCMIASYILLLKIYTNTIFLSNPGLKSVAIALQRQPKFGLEINHLLAFDLAVLVRIDMVEPLLSYFIIIIIIIIALRHVYRFTVYIGGNSYSLYKI